MVFVHYSIAVDRQRDFVELAAAIVMLALVVVVMMLDFQLPAVVVQLDSNFVGDLVDLPYPIGQHLDLYLYQYSKAGIPIRFDRLTNRLRHRIISIGDRSLHIV
jgi:hypothetical protein